ncbi:MAG: hypothetical protein IE931_14675 [Sphingobacteriales bacterium]|nr:hypothetical protein [Sphingobacteriales bacterium]
MSFFKVSVEDAAKTTTEGNYINQSGVYDVTIKAIIVDYNDKGARTLSFYIEHNGQEQVLYGALRLDNNDGTSSFQAAQFNKLCVIAGLDTVAEPEEATLPIGKNGADKDVAILPDFVDLDVKIWIQFEYSVYNGSIKERKLIKGFYAANGASADEIINDTEYGVRFAKDEKYHSNTTYKDGLTAETVQKWIADGRKEGTMGKTTVAPKVSFGKPKFGGK